MKINVVISSNFFESYTGLPKEIQRKVMNFFEKFIENPRAKGINWEKIGTQEGKELHSVRINKTYRGIVYVDDKNNTYHILWVEHHDEAYDRVDRLPKINLAPNAFYIQGSGYYSQEGIPVKREKKLFENIDTKELKSLGVPLKHILLVKSLPDFQAFQKTQGLLEADVYTKLEFIAIGFHIEEVKEHEIVVREELLDYIKEEVVDKALACEVLDPDIKESVENTRQALERKQTVKEIMDYFNDSLESRRGKQIVAEFRKHGLKAFEDIVEEVKKIGAK